MKITIDKNKCTGCGLCISACHMGVIGLVDGKAEVLKENVCDGLGRCLPICPTAAITLEDVKETLPRKVGNEALSHQWPLQLALVLEHASFLENCHLLIAADCTAFVYPNFRETYMEGKVTLIACPKLDTDNYSEKIAAILSQNKVQSLTVCRMEVPCCSGIVHAAQKALEISGIELPFEVVNISTGGKVLA